MRRPFLILSYNCRMLLYTLMGERNSLPCSLSTYSAQRLPFEGEDLLASLSLLYISGC